MDAVLGIDLGTSGVKVAALRLNGEVLSAGGGHYPLLPLRQGWVEQDPADWWRAVCAAARTCAAGLPPGVRIRAIGLSGHMSGLVLVDASGQPVRNCIMLADLRTAHQSFRLERDLGERILLLTGNPPLDAFVAPKLLWVKENEPEVYRRAACFLLPKDFIRLQMTGRTGTEPTDAGNTLFLDPARGEWDLDLLGAMGLDERLLPPLLGTTEVVGALTAGAAAAMGLKPSIPVVAGGGDMACSAIGTGAVTEGVVAVTIGTSAQVVTCVSGVQEAGAGRVTFHPHAQPGRLFAMGSILSGGLSMRWLARALGEEERLAAEGGAYFAALSAEAARAGAGSGGVLFLPFLVGSGSPFWDAAARAGWLGLTLGTGRAQLVRAVMEGVAYNCRDSLEVFRQMGSPAARVHMGGGGAASPVWRAIVAAALGCEVVQPANPDASAVGAAALAAIGAGLVSDMQSASRQMVRYGEPMPPDPEMAAAYARLYPVYQLAVTALAPVYDSLSAHGPER